MTENNKLEELLEQSLKDPSKRADFVTELLGSTVYVVGKQEMRENPEGKTAPAVKLLHITNKDGEYAVPFFTSRRMLDTFAPGTPFVLETIGFDFFESVQKSDVVLNPNTKNARPFKKEEIKFILGLKDLVSSGADVSKGSKIKVNVLKNFPKELANILADFFAKKDNVKKAYLSEIQYENQEAHPIVIVDFEGDKSILFPEIGAVTEEYLKSINGFIDIIAYDDEGISGIMLEKATPIYYQHKVPAEE